MSEKAGSVATSPAPYKHDLAVQSPLTLIMKIKSPVDYEQLHATLVGIQALPSDKNPVWAALELLKTVHFARFVFMENNTRLAVITTYDGKFEDYIADFTRVIGDIFNALLVHMEGAPPLPVQKNPKEFLEYVRNNDLGGMPPFYSAYPKSTVSDIHKALQAQAELEGD